jgi:hypothetical protein
MGNLIRPRLTRKTLWGTYGKGGFEHCAGMCPEHQLHWKPLDECDSDHLQMILRNQRQVDECPPLKQIIHEILFERGEVVPAFDPAAERRLAEAAIDGFFTVGLECRANETSKKKYLVS